MVKGDCYVSARGHQACILRPDGRNDMGLRQVGRPALPGEPEQWPRR